MLQLRGFLTLTVFLLLGESLVFLLGWPISGGVSGMILLTSWLMLTGNISEELAVASRTLISVLILLIMPGVVGVFFLGGQFAGEWTAVTLALVLGTFLSVLTTFMLMLRFTPAGPEPDDRE